MHSMDTKQGIHVGQTGIEPQHSHKHRHTRETVHQSQSAHKRNAQKHNTDTIANTYHTHKHNVEINGIQ